MAIHEDGDLLVADDEGHISKLKKDAMDTGTRPLGPGPGQTVKKKKQGHDVSWRCIYIQDLAGGFMFFFNFFYPLIGEK